MSDLISRQAAIDEIKALYEWHEIVTEDRAIDHFKRLPSAQPERKKGRWIWYELGERDTYYCSECGEVTKIPHYVGGLLYNFCPWCGAKMEE